MIAYLSGQLKSKDLNYAVILTGGVGYRVSMPISDLSIIGPEDTQINLHIHTHVREDALELFGFCKLESLRFFEKLISISGVGPKLALSILSAMSASELSGTLASGDFKSLTRIPGVGMKTAQRLVLELKDKVAATPLFEHNGNAILSDLRSAISNLGYKAPQVEKAIKSVFSLSKTNPDLSVLLKEALREIHA